MRLPERLGVNDGARSLRTDADRIERRCLGVATAGGSSRSSCIGVSGRRPMRDALTERGLPEALERGDASGEDLVRARGDGGELDAPMSDLVAAARIGSSTGFDWLRRRASSADDEGVTRTIGTMGDLRLDLVRSRRRAAMTEGDSAPSADERCKRRAELSPSVGESAYAVGVVGLRSDPLDDTFAWNEDGSSWSLGRSRGR